MKKRLTVLGIFLMLAVDARAIQDPSQSTTQAAARQGSRPSSIASNDADDSSLVIHLSGKIVMADGSTIPQSVDVDLSCHGRITRQTHASNNGHFRMALGSSGQIGAGLTDASTSVPGNTSFGSSTAGQVYSNVSGRKLTRGLALGRVDLTGCQIQVKSVPGYRAESVELGPVGKFEGDVGYIYLSPLAGVTGATISSKTLLAPKSAAREYEKARKELARKSSDRAKAVRGLEKAIAIYPDFAEAWSLLGELRLSENDLARAREAFRNAINIEPRYVTPYLSFARLELFDNRWTEAARISDRIVELNPYLPQGRYLHALAHFQLQDFPVAERSILTLQNGSKELRWPFIEYMMGTILARRGEYTAAARELARFLERPLPASAAPMVEKAIMQLTDWERRGWIPKPQRTHLSKTGESCK